mmetsp:Transcript_20059/g.33294  ORF Transcript_20059/g.33294 Transcript_20059/m.33294 type:complete len:320 (+) Transcript_20059:438-1397(+)
MGRLRLLCKCPLMMVVVRVLSRQTLFLFVLFDTSSLRSGSHFCLLFFPHFLTIFFIPSDASDSSPTNNNAQSSASSSNNKPVTKKATRRVLSTNSTGMRLNKFVRRLHDMLQSEQGSGICEWRRGLLVLHSTDAFAKTILPKYFNTRNFKTFRRQLNYYGFVHVRSFSTTGSTTTALWVNRDLAQHGTAQISSVLQLKRVEPCESAKTAEGRRVRKELAVSTVEDDIGVSAKSLQLEQIRSMAMHCGDGRGLALSAAVVPQQQQQQQVPLFVHCPMTVPAALMAPPPSLEHYQQPSTGDNESAANLLLMLSKSSVPYQQ